MIQYQAEHLRDELEPLLPEFEVTAVPWHNEGPKDEWIVTVWADSEGGFGEALLDIFGARSWGAEPTFVLRKIGRGRVLGRTGSVAGIPALVRATVQPT